MIKGRLHILALLAALLAGLIAMAAPAAAEPRLALIIGNGKYGKEIGSLINPPNDAELMAERLNRLGFKVTKLVNGDQKAMKRAISNFGQALQSAGPDAVGLFFYAGHGIQVDGANYLIPVGAAIKAEADVDLEAVSAEAVLKQMEYAGARVNIVILDACRNNPLPRSMRSADRGLARMDAPTGSFIAYSTSPGNVAEDGAGRNSPYTRALAEELDKPGIAIEEAFRNVRVKVMADTSKQQVPWESSSLTGAFFFQPGQMAAPATANPLPSAANVQPANAKELAYWDGVKDSKDPADFDAYLARYPDGAHADVAQDKLSRLRKAPQVAQRAADEAPKTGAPKPETPVASATEPAADQVASLPSDTSFETATADGLRLSDKATGALKSYLSALGNHNGAFAVSPDGLFAGFYVCQEVGQCVPGKKGVPQNTDPLYPQKAALQKCRSAAKQQCIVIMARGNRKRPFELAGE